jgi:HTH-type transcriptional regulator / antitoxin HigA
MPHILDPKRLSTDEDYSAALDELEDLMTADPDTPGGRRFDELASLIEDYERGYPSARYPRSRPRR